jgi:hypothetical protein
MFLLLRDLRFGVLIKNAIKTKKIPRFIFLYCQLDCYDNGNIFVMYNPFRFFIPNLSPIYFFCQMYAYGIFHLYKTIWILYLVFSYFWFLWFNEYRSEAKKKRLQRQHSCERNQMYLSFSPSCDNISSFHTWACHVLKMKSL